MPKVFVSHSTQDRDFVEQELIPLLRSHGIDVWYCKEDIKSSSDWEASIRNGLKSCDWFMVVMSSHAQESEWVRCEVNWALDNRKGKVIPLLIEDCEPTDINLRLTILQYVDFRKKDEAAVTNLLSNWAIDYRGDKTKRLSIYPAVLGPINLGFEDPPINGSPPGWFNSRIYVSYVSSKYEFSVLPREDKGGNCVRMFREKAGKKEFGSLMQRCVGNYLEGKTVRFQGEVRTNDLEKRAGMWFRADGDSSPLFFYNMSDRPITGTTGWKKYSMEIELPKGTMWLNYGILLSGNGELWADNFDLSYRDEDNKWVPMNQWVHWLPLGIYDKRW